MGWQRIGLIQAQPHWVGFPVPLGSQQGMLKVEFHLYGPAIRIYSRILIRQVLRSDEMLLRSPPIRVFPDLNQQIISFPPSLGTLEFFEIKRGYRSWRWRNIKDSAHLIGLASFVPE